MGITDILSLLGGLALFLYGMQMMSTGLEAAAGNKMKSILEKLTSNRIKGVLVGAGITAVIQSSSASVGILQALAATGQAAQALDVLQALKEIPEPHWLLQMGKYVVACGQKAEAGVFLQRFLETVPQGLEALVATQQYATILIEQKRYVDGAKVLLRQAELFSGQNQKNIALLSAAQCFYQAECYADCIAVLSRIPSFRPAVLSCLPKSPCHL